jgi:hypothetical protein
VDHRRKLPRTLGAERDLLDRVRAVSVPSEHLSPGALAVRDG